MFLVPLSPLMVPRRITADHRGEHDDAAEARVEWRGPFDRVGGGDPIRTRRRLADFEPCNRTYNDDERTNEWQDANFARWDAKSKDKPFIDDDLLGFMQAEGAKQEGGKGGAKVRRAVLEVTRAVSLTPWPGDVTFNAASPGATASAQKKGSNPVPYATEMHATRYSMFRFHPGKAARAVPGETRAACAWCPRRCSRQSRSLSLRFQSGLDCASCFGRPGSSHSVRVRATRQRIAHRRYCTQGPAGDIAPTELVIGGAIIGALTPMIAQCSRMRGSWKA